MQKAQSFEQPRDYNYTNKQKNTKPKFVIGIEDPNDNSNKIKNNNISNKKTNITIPNKINNNLNQNKNYIRNKNNTSISNKIYSNTIPTSSKRSELTEIIPKKIIMNII
jgi:hypothetical protein